MSKQIEDVLAIMGVVLVVFVIALSAFVLFQVFTQDTEQSSAVLTPIPLTTTPVATIAPTYPTVNQLTVESVNVSILEIEPVWVTARVSGFFLDDGCASAPVIATVREQSTFYITVTKQRPAGQVCTRESISFEERVALDVSGLPIGTYTVDVNDFTTTFALDTSGNALATIEIEDVPDLDQEDLAELMHQTLEHALVKQEIPYFEKLAEQAEIVLSTENIVATLVPELEDVALVSITPEAIQAKADAGDHFPYLRFRRITAVSDDEAHVFLSITWARPTDSDTLSLLGGGLTINFRQSFGRWKGEITEVRRTL